MTIDKVHADVLQHIDDFGWTVIGVGATTSDPPDAKTFSYTVGMAVHGGYEFCIGGLNPRTAHGILAVVWEQLQNGWRAKDGAIETDFANLPCRLQLMTDEHEANMARWFWSQGEAGFQVMQIVWGDKEGKLPGEIGFDDGFGFIERQQIPGSTLSAPLAQWLEADNIAH